MTRPGGSRVWLEIDLARLKDNLSKIQERVKPCGVVAVLKANAYGLGMLPIAQTLAESGIAGFAVAEPGEAFRLGCLGFPVQILGGVLRNELSDTVAAGIIHPIDSYETAEAISREARRQNRTATCHFLIDTGMGRLGILAEKAADVIARAVTLPNLNCTGIYSHFPVAYRTGEEYTTRQIQTFKDLLKILEKQKITFTHIHIANSDAINNFPETCRPPFNLVRTGINLHGSFDSEGIRALNLEPILQLKTNLVAVRKLPAGMQLGYGLTHTLMDDTLVGTVAAGYADGLPLALSNRGYVLINDQLCPILGRISMDYITVSLENVPNAVAGDEVICLGGTGLRAITVDKWAQLKGTHPYEIICSFGSRVERRYING